MVSSTLGSLTSTGWNRRSSAASFSMCLRYSSSVVAPMARSSPRASIGLSMLPASMAPSAAPAPTMVCSSSMNVMISPSLSAISRRTALNRSSNSPRYFEPATIAPMSSATTRLSLSDVGHVARHDPLGEPLDDGRLAHAGLADQDRVVLGPSGEHLDDPADLVVPPDDGVELALAGELGQVAAVPLERLVLLLGVLVGDPLASPDLGQRRRGRRPGSRPASPRSRAPSAGPRAGPGTGARWRRTRR